MKFRCMNFHLQELRTNTTIQKSLEKLHTVENDNNLHIKYSYVWKITEKTTLRLNLVQSHELQSPHTYFLLSQS